ncbi:LPS-assembly protein LptD [candidate division WOR-3 bacterium]|nr:LPS-assembly protein LptD [candidate division WOR-3 bacterium]
MLLFFLLAGQFELGGVESEVSDTLPGDTTYQDSISLGVSSVKFGADTLIFYTETKEVLLLHNGWVEYGDTKVFSDSIRFSTSERVLSAYKKARLFSDRDSVVGSVMHYAVESGKGMMEHGKTQIEKGYFYGKGIWLVEEDVLLITNGYYTTCDKENPHYDFYGLQLKVLLDDMVISKPIFLRFRLFNRWKVPVLAAPFWYLPIGSDRKSGLMPFKVGHNPQEGYYAKQIRYYWVTNDYSQATFSLDIMSEKGFRPGAYFEWDYGPQRAKYLSGKASGNYINERTASGTRFARWNLSLDNTSYIPDGTVITVDANYESDQTYLQEYMEDEDSTTLVLDRDRQTYANLSVSRRLLGRQAALTASRKDDLQTGSWDMNLPTFNFSWPSVSLWDFFSLGFGSFRVNNAYAHDVTWIQDTLTGDSTRMTEDSRITTFNQPLSLAWSYKFFGAYTYNQNWGAGQSLTWTQDTLIRGGSYSFSHGLSTQLFRLFGVYAIGMNGLLHTITPRITHYVTPRTDTIHPWLVYPRFDTTLASHSLNFDITQTFQTKFRSRSDTTKFNKQTLLTISTGSGYNLLTDSLDRIKASVLLPSGLPVYANLSAAYNIYNDTLTLTSNVDLSIDEIVFPLLGWREKRRESRILTEDALWEEDTLGLWEEEPVDSLFPEDTSLTDSLPADTLTREEKETFLERFSKSRLYITDYWSLGGQLSTQGLTTTSHMLSLNTALYLPWDIELRLSASTNLTPDSKQTWKDYLTNYNMELVKGLHCWEMVFEVRSKNLELESLDWSLYFRIKELPDIQLGKGMFEQFTDGE